jgi:hypothetical protein
MTPESRNSGARKKSVAMQRLGKHVDAATDMHATKELLGTVFYEVRSQVIGVPVVSSPAVSYCLLASCEHGSRGISIVRRGYQATASEDKAD